MRMTVTRKGRSRRSTQIRMNAHEFEWRAFAFITDHRLSAIPAADACTVYACPDAASLMPEE
jgi:hypothetical protein